jgi:hypothetical protein
MLKNKCCLYVIISIRFFSITICNLLIELPSHIDISMHLLFLYLSYENAWLKLNKKQTRVYCAVTLMQLALVNCLP